MKALFITGSNQYGVVSHFLNGMAEDLRGLSVSVDILNIESSETIAQGLKDISGFMEYDFIVSFNGIGTDIEVEGFSISQFSNSKKLFIFLVDHPIHLLVRFIDKKTDVLRKAITLCVDKEHANFFELCGFKSEYFPHAVSEIEAKSSSLQPVEAKNQEIIFPASYFDTLQWREKLSPAWHQISSLIDHSESVTRFMQGLGVLPLGNRPATQPLNQNTLLISCYVDLYLRGRKRHEFIKHFAEQEIQLTVIGKGVDQYASKHPFHKYEQALDYDSLLERIRNAKYVAHNSPGFSFGFHERVIQPYSLGTLVTSYQTPFIESQCAGFATPPSSIAALSDEDYAQYQRKGHRWVVNNHTWKARWQPLLEKYYGIAAQDETISA